MVKSEKKDLLMGEISEEKLVKELKSELVRIGKEEKLASKEQKVVAKEILQQQEEEETKKLLTNPSAIALSQTDKEPGETLERVRKTVRQLMILYTTNQFVARAINVRADTLVSRGYKIIGDDKKGVDACIKLIENSGGINLFWQHAVNTYIAGDGFLEKKYNKNKTKITQLKHVHPLTLGFKKDMSTGKIIVGNDNQPVGYVQYYTDSNGKTAQKDISKDVIAHMRFNTLGDEFTGISLIQPGYDTIVRLMNMEWSAAEAAVKSANPLIVGYCNTKSPHQIAMWGQILGNISGRDQLFIPDGMKIEFMSPGPQNFNDYADYFLSALVATFGTPKAILLGASEDSGNRAEGIILSRHFYSAIRGDQRYESDFFYEIFKEYGELASFKAPKLVFEDLAEDAALLATSAMDLYAANIITLEEARQMIGLEIKAESVAVSGQGTANDIKKERRQVQFPEEPGSAAGSQANVKSKQRASPFSEVSPLEK